jgi:hypothetical protein
MIYQVGQLYICTISDARKFLYIYQIDDQIRHFYGFFDKRKDPKSFVINSHCSEKEFDDMIKRSYEPTTINRIILHLYIKNAFSGFEPR